MVRGASRFIACVATAWLGSVVLPAEACDMAPSETGTVAAVLDGETLRLTDGKTVRLIGAKAPMPPLGWRGDDPWPLLDEAREGLSALAMGRTVELGFGGRRLDRHGYLLAQAHIVDGANRLWLQRELVARGLARVYSFPDNRACVAELLTLERDARAKRLGVWGSPAYRVASALDMKRLGRLIHSYQLVEGTVVAVGEGGGRLYLNFATDWRSDFTISIARKDVSAFAAAGIDLNALAGHRVRARGFLAWRNGPMIEASHPEQIELLPESGAEEARPPSRQRGPAIAL
jgi:endonuclease YncB( thermonuclease family)